MKVSFKYLRKYQGFWHVWSILFKKDYKYGGIRQCLYYHKELIAIAVDSYLSKFDSYHYQGLTAWLYNRLYTGIEHLTPFLKWSRWTFIQCQNNTGKYITDNTNYIIRKTTSAHQTYYSFLTMFGYLRVVEKSYVDNNGESKSLFLMGIQALCDGKVPEYKEVKRTVYSGFIFTRKQAINAIKFIKANSSLTWDSSYCDADTYFIDSAIKDNSITYESSDERMDYIKNDIEHYLEINDDPIVRKYYMDIDVYSSDDIKKYEKQILYRLGLIQERMKEIGYIRFTKKDFMI